MVQLQILKIWHSSVKLYLEKRQKTKSLHILNVRGQALFRRVKQKLFSFFWNYTKRQKRKTKSINQNVLFWPYFFQKKYYGGWWWWKVTLVSVCVHFWSFSTQTQSLLWFSWNPLLNRKKIFINFIPQKHIKLSHGAQPS